MNTISHILSIFLLSPWVVGVSLCLIVFWTLWIYTQRSQNKRLGEERRDLDLQNQRKREEYAKWKMQASNRLSDLPTSSTTAIKGYRIINQVKMVNVSGFKNKQDAEFQFLLEVERSGANGVINMRIRPHRGGLFSVQGDAVMIE